MVGCKKRKGQTVFRDQLETTSSSVIFHIMVIVA